MSTTFGDRLFSGTFDTPAIFKLTKDSAEEEVNAIIYEGSEPGGEAGKGLTKIMRGMEAGFGRIILRVDELSAKPQVHSIIEEGDDVWDITSVDVTRIGTYRCSAKKNVRGRSHVRPDFD